MYEIGSGRVVTVSGKRRQVEVRDVDDAEEHRTQLRARSRILGDNRRRETGWALLVFVLGHFLVVGW